MDYKNAGVDIEAGYKSVELMKEHVKKTMRPEVLGGLGGFSGAFSLAKIKEMAESMQLRCVSMILHVQEENHYFSWITSHVERITRKRSHRS